MMSSSDAPPPSAYSQLSVATLRRAAAIYMEIAYAGTRPSPSVLKRLEWMPGDDALTVMSQPPFEKVGRSAGGETPIFALRLGNARYPHMKMQIQHWSAEAGFLLSVNTHDQVLALDPKSPDAAAIRALQAENQKLKQSIEQAWDEGGLPIFLRYLRNYLKGHGDASNPSS